MLSSQEPTSGFSPDPAEFSAHPVSSHVSIFLSYTSVFDLFAGPNFTSYPCVLHVPLISISWFHYSDNFGQGRLRITNFTEKFVFTLRLEST
jgi:hypothetical protein